MFPYGVWLTRFLTSSGQACAIHSALVGGQKEAKQAGQSHAVGEIPVFSSRAELAGHGNLSEQLGFGLLLLFFILVLPLITF